VALIVFGVYSGYSGLRNDHYIFDNATLEFPRAGDSIGMLEAGGLVVGTVLIATALRASIVADKR